MVTPGKPGVERFDYPHAVRGLRLGCKEKVDKQSK